ncbi:MAG: DUF1284 domain-containing protein [Nanoarchaeota archaeon]|nr:DUF1284 domain-containing protein [Nanoarchaeota archaeon]
MRGHHLLCMRYFLGKGYSDPFVENFSQVLVNISKGEEVRVVSKPGVICSVCPHNKNGCAKKGMHSEERMHEIDLHVMGTLGLRENQEIDLRRLSPQIVARLPELMLICKTCQWKPLCDRFEERKRLLPESTPSFIKNK